MPKLSELDQTSIQHLRLKTTTSLLVCSHSGLQTQRSNHRDTQDYGATHRLNQPRQNDRSFVVATGQSDSRTQREQERYAAQQTLRVSSPPAKLGKPDNSNSIPSASESVRHNPADPELPVVVVCFLRNGVSDRA